jgi:hypothetical protein
MTKIMNSNQSHKSIAHIGLNANYFHLNKEYNTNKSYRISRDICKKQIVQMSKSYIANLDASDAHFGKLCLFTDAKTENVEIQK